MGWAACVEARRDGIRPSLDLRKIALRIATRLQIFIPKPI